MNVNNTLTQKSIPIYIEKTNYLLEIVEILQQQIQIINKDIVNIEQSIEGLDIDAITQQLNEIKEELITIQNDQQTMSTDINTIDANIITIQNDIVALYEEINNAEKFRGYFMAVVELDGISNPKAGDYAYVTETGTKWVYGENASWTDTGTPIPNQAVPPSDSNPLMNGSVDPGTSTEYSRGDHVHPTDSRIIDITHSVVDGVRVTSVANKLAISSIISEDGNEIFNQSDLVNNTTGHKWPRLVSINEVGGVNVGSSIKMYTEAEGDAPFATLSCNEVSGGINSSTSIHGVNFITDEGNLNDTINAITGINADLTDVKDEQTAIAAQITDMNVDLTSVKSEQTTMAAQITSMDANLTIVLSEQIDQNGRLDALEDDTRDITYIAETNLTSIPKINVDSIYSNDTEIWNKNDLNITFNHAFPRLTCTKSDGVTEVGRHVNFRQNAIPNYDWRLSATDTSFTIASPNNGNLRMDTTGATSKNFITETGDLNTIIDEQTEINTNITNITSEQNVQNGRLDDIEAVLPAIGILQDKTSSLSKFSEVSGGIPVTTTSFDLGQITIYGGTVLNKSAVGSAASRDYQDSGRGFIPFVRTDGGMWVGKSIKFNNNPAPNHVREWEIMSTPAAASLSVRNNTVEQLSIDSEGAHSANFTTPSADLNELKIISDQHTEDIANLNPDTTQFVKNNEELHIGFSSPLKLSENSSAVTTVPDWNGNTDGLYPGINTDTASQSIRSYPVLDEAYAHKIEKFPNLDYDIIKNISTKNTDYTTIIPLTKVLYSMQETENHANYWSEDKSDSIDWYLYFEGTTSIEETVSNFKTNFPKTTEGTPIGNMEDLESIVEGGNYYLTNDITIDRDFLIERELYTIDITSSTGDPVSIDIYNNEQTASVMPPYGGSGIIFSGIASIDGPIPKLIRGNPQYLVTRIDGHKFYIGYYNELEYELSSDGQLTISSSTLSLGGFDDVYTISVTNSRIITVMRISNYNLNCNGYSLSRSSQDINIDMGTIYNGSLTFTPNNAHGIINSIIYNYNQFASRCISRVYNSIVYAIENDGYIFQPNYPIGTSIIMNSLIFNCKIGRLSTDIYNSIIWNCDIYYTVSHDRLYNSICGYLDKPSGTNSGPIETAHVINNLIYNCNSTWRGRVAAYCTQYHNNIMMGCSSASGYLVAGHYSPSMSNSIFYNNSGSLFDDSANMSNLLLMDTDCAIKSTDVINNSISNRPISGTTSDNFINSTHDTPFNIAIDNPIGFPFDYFRTSQDDYTLSFTSDGLMVNNDPVLTANNANMTNCTIQSLYLGDKLLLDSNSLTSNNMPTTPFIPVVKQDRVMEIGEYLDFHSADSTGFSWRMRGTTSLQFMADNTQTVLSYINSSGDYTKASDRRLKSNIEPLTEEDGNKVLSLNPCTYDIFGKHTQGLIAQEVQEFIPGVVHKSDENDLLSIEYSGLIPYLIKTIQNMNRQIQELSAELTTVKEQVKTIS